MMTAMLLAICGFTFAEEVTVFSETFAGCESKGGNSTDGWSGSIANGTFGEGSADNTGWVLTKGNAASGCIKLGTSSVKGVAVTPALEKLNGEATLTFKAGAWNNEKESTTLNISISEGTLSESSVTLVKGEWTTYTITITGGTSASKITFEAAQASKNRFFLDDVVITAEAVDDGTTTPVMSFENTLVKKTTSDKSPYTGQAVTMTINDEDVTSKYTYIWSSSDENVATVSGTGAEPQITIVGAGTTTIKVEYAGDEENKINSTYKSYTLKVLNVYEDIAALKEAAADGILKFDNVVVTYVNGSNVYMQDESGAICLYGSSNYTAGEILNGQTEVTWAAYKNLPEITDVDKEELTVTKGDAPEPTEMTAAEALEEANLCKYVKITGATVTSGKIDNLTLYDQYKLVTGSKSTLSYTGTYNVVGICGVYNTTYELFLISMAVPVTITDAGYATLYYSAHNLTVPDGVKARGCSVDGTNIKELDAYTVIPAGEAVLLKGDTADYEFFVTTESATANESNELLGFDEATTTTGPTEGTDYKFYMLSKVDGVVGFYYGAEGGAAFESQAHKAYLPVESSSAAKCYVFGETTGVKNIEATVEEVDNAPVYDLQGRRVVNPTKGIYVKNGKKFVVNK